MKLGKRAPTLVSVFAVVALVAGACSSTPAATPAPTAAPATAAPATAAPATAAPATASAAATSAASASAAGGVPIPTDTSPVTINWWVDPAYQNAPGVEALSKNFGDWETYQAAQFMKLYPNVTIKTQVVNYQDFTAKLSAAFAANQQPDVLRSGWQRQTSILYTIPDQYEDLQALLPDAFGRLTDYFKNLGLVNGSFKLYPYTGSVGGLGANKGLITAAGATYPVNGIFTRADFEAICAKVVVPGKVWCLAQQVANPTLEPLGFFWGSGAQFLDPAQKKVIINSPAGVDTLNWLLSLKQKGWLYPGESTAQYTDDALALRQGKVAFAAGYGYISEKDYLDTLGPAAPGYAFDILPYPQLNGIKDGGMSINPSGFSVTKQTDPNKKAWIAAFLDYLLSPAYMTQYQEAGSGIPVINNPPAVGGRLADLINEQATFVQELGLNDEAFAAHNFSKLVTDFFPELQAAFLGKKTAQQALDDYAAKGNAALAAP